MKRVPESHADHVPAAVLRYVLEAFRDRDGFFVETVTLPEGFPSLACGLYGPACGDDPVAEGEVVYQSRPGRSWPSRLVRRPPRPTRLLTVVAGPYGADPCVLYTCYGGPTAPYEVDDPHCPDAVREVSVRFWSEHALAAE